MYTNNKQNNKKIVHIYFKIYILYLYENNLQYVQQRPEVYDTGRPWRRIPVIGAWLLDYSEMVAEIDYK